MKRLVLFSNPLVVLEKIEHLIFPQEIQNKKMAYMPADGIFKQQHYEYWREVANRNNAELIYINNVSLKPHEEAEKLLNCNILMVTGGKLTLAMHNLRKSGLGKSILQFLDKENFIYTGFSSGAMILTPSIELADRGKWKEGLIELNDMSGLSVIDYEILPHYIPENDDDLLNDYRRTSKNKVRTLQDDEYILIENGKEITK